MTLTQKLEVVSDTSEITLFLLEFYYSKSGTKYDYTDKQVATAINWTEKKVAENRRKLEKAGYFKREVTKNSKASTLNVLLGHSRWQK
jgi:DNA-binding Lrp family transcriptional regulator